MINEIGFMQGRLVNSINNKIQAFPIKNWKKEFQISKKMNIHLMEWTLDYHKLYSNPLMTSSGRELIKYLKKKYNLKIESITCDSVMQKPFWRKQNYKLKNQLFDIAEAANRLTIKYLIVPIIDNSKIKLKSEEQSIINFFNKNKNFFKKKNVQILFETDFFPKKYRDFLECMPRGVYNVNYDIGNSTSYQFNPIEEFAIYGSRIKNVHVKDKNSQGISVPLGEGLANFNLISSLLKSEHYKGNLILQTARNKTNHSQAIIKYCNFIKKYWN